MNGSLVKRQRVAYTGCRKGSSLEKEWRASISILPLIFGSVFLVASFYCVGSQIKQTYLPCDGFNTHSQTPPSSAKFAQLKSGHSQGFP